MTIIDSETEENHETIAIATVGEANETSERVDENQAQMIATDESDSAYGNNNENNYGNSSVVSPVERSPLELATGGEPEHIEERKSDICCVCCFDVSPISSFVYTTSIVARDAQQNSRQSSNAFHARFSFISASSSLQTCQHHFHFSQCHRHPGFNCRLFNGECR